MKASVWWLMSVVLVGLAGCGGGDSDSSGSTATAPDATPPTAQTTPAAQPAPLTAAATTNSPALANNADPRQVVDVFLKAMRDGDKQAVENLLTQKAREEVP